MNSKYTEEQRNYIREQYLINGPEWEDIAENFNRKFKQDRTGTGIMRAYERYCSKMDVDEDKFLVSNLRYNSRVRKSNSVIRKENKILLNHLNFIGDVEETARKLVKDIKLPKPKIAKDKSIDKSKKDITICQLLSDLHYGKHVKGFEIGSKDSFNLDIARRRMSYLADVFIREVQDAQKTFNVTELIVALMGDIVESYTMHGDESSKGCEFGNSRQMLESTMSIFKDFIEPVAALGIPIRIPCITGNHDRTNKQKTMTDMDEEHMTYVIYGMIEELCKSAGYDHITFIRTKQNYIIIDIFGDKILVHHGDHAFKGNGHDKLIKFRLDVEAQVGYKIQGSWSGHTHESMIYGGGKDVVNGCLPGQDGYAHARGYATVASQTILSYIGTKRNRPKFYKGFHVYLENIK